MSSAILLVAIVAIWACALVPRWVRRSHEATSEPGVPVGDEESPGLEDGDVEAEFGYEASELDEYDTIAADHGYDHGYDGDDGYDSDDRYDSDDGYNGADVTPGEAGGAGFVPHAHVGPGDHAGPGVLVGHLPGRAEDYGEAGTHPRASRPARVYPEYPAPPPLPRPAERARVLRARRRTLTLLVLLLAAALGGAVLRVSHWWLTIPPAGMLGFYVMLLRAAVYADTENAARRAAGQARAVAAARSARAAAAREREQAAAAARAPQPSAEVIDIGQRVAQAADPDEPYDQYADGTARAIGD